jgi:hypothetical protein
MVGLITGIRSFDGFVFFSTLVGLVREVLHGSLETIAAEPAEHFLSAVLWKDHSRKSNPQDRSTTPLSVRNSHCSILIVGLHENNMFDRSN